VESNVEPVPMFDDVIPGEKNMDTKTSDETLHCDVTRKNEDESAPVQDEAEHETPGEA